MKLAKNANQEITKLVAEITSLYGVLNSLQLVARRFEGDGIDSMWSITRVSHGFDRPLDRVRNDASPPYRVLP